MATIVSTSVKADALKVEPTTTTLDGTDTLTYLGKHSRQLLVLHNATGGALNILIDGDESAAFNSPGYGQVDPTSGFPIAVADGETQTILLSGIDKFLAGTIAITGGTGATAELYDIS